MRFRLREGEKVAQGHTAEPGLKYSSGSGGEPYPRSPPLPSESPPSKAQGKPPQLPRPRANTDSADHRWERPAQRPPLCLSKATLSGGPTGRGQAWPRITPAKGGHSKLRPAATSTPAPSVPAPALRGPQMPPPWPSGPGLAPGSLRERHEDTSPPGKGTGWWQGPAVRHI